MKKPITFLALALILSSCKGEKYKNYEDLQKKIEIEKAAEEVRREESRTFDIQNLNGVLPNTVLQSQFFEKMDVQSASSYYDQFLKTIDSKPLDSAVNLTLATNPWVQKNPDFSKISMSSSLLDSKSLIKSSVIPGDLFILNGNRVQDLILALSINLNQAYIHSKGSKFIDDPNLKLVLASLLFSKKAQSEIAFYIQNKGTRDQSIANQSRVRSRRYLELSIATAVLSNKSNTYLVEKLLNYPIHYEGFKKDAEMKFEMFPGSSEQTMASVVKSKNDLLNIAFYSLGYKENITVTYPNGQTKTSIDSNQIKNDKLVELAIEYLK